jgi:hypothetical protein
MTDWEQLIEAESYMTCARTTIGRRFRKWQAAQGGSYIYIGWWSLKDTSTHSDPHHTHTEE